MKILFLTHDLRGDYGAGVFSHRLVKAMMDHGNKVVVLTSESSGSPIEKAILYPQKMKLLREFLHIRRIMKDCDIIHALDGFPYGVLAVLLSRGLGKKVIITAVGSGAIIPLYSRFWVWIMRYSYRHADRVTAISNFTKQEILKRVHGLSIHVINHGVDVKRFERAQMGGGELEVYQPYILSVGTLRWRKGYHFSIRAFAKIAKEFPDISYVIVGKKYKEDYYVRLQNLIDELGLRNRIFILEDVNDREKLAHVYKSAELFCLFSQNVNHDVEGFGLVFLEAAAAGLPVVGAKNCGIDDAVKEGENGFLVATRNPDDFANAILEILRDPELKKRMGEHSLAFAKECAWEKRIGEYIDIYNHIC